MGSWQGAEELAACDGLLLRESQPPSAARTATGRRHPALLLEMSSRTKYREERTWHAQSLDRLETARPTPRFRAGHSRLPPWRVWKRGTQTGRGANDSPGRGHGAHEETSLPDSRPHPNRPGRPDRRKTPGEKPRGRFPLRQANFTGVRPMK